MVNRQFLAGMFLLGLGLNPANAGTVWDSNGGYIPPDQRQTSGSVSYAQQQGQSPQATAQYSSYQSTGYQASSLSQDALMTETISVNVKAQIYGDFVGQLIPPSTGWRVEFRSVPQSILGKHVDAIYSQVQRRQILKELLDNQGLTAQWFPAGPGINVPTVIISEL